MANISKKDVIKRLDDLGVCTGGITDYKVLCEMLKGATMPEPVAEKPADPTPEPETAIGGGVHLESRIPKRNTFLADSVRDDRDAVVLNTELRKRIHKGKVVKIVTTKYAEVTAEGDWLTEFDIYLKG